MAEDKRTTRHKKIKAGPTHRARDRFKQAINPDKTVEELAHLILMTPKDYVVDISSKMETQLWIARMLGELHTIYEVIEVAKKQGRAGIDHALVASIRDHVNWQAAIKKMRVNYLVESFAEIPLAHAVVRIRELAELYYKLMGKYPAVKFKVSADGELTRVEEDQADDEAAAVSSFDKDTTTIEIWVGGKDGRLVKIKKNKFFAEATKILEQIRVELEHADLTLTSDAEFINIIRECGFVTYEA